MVKPIIRQRRVRKHVSVHSGGPAHSSEATASTANIDIRALALAIDVQRRRLFEVTAILACLGAVLDDVYVPDGPSMAPDLEHVADVLIRMLDGVASALDPTTLQLDVSARGVPG
jgi:hypothetical protein